jgi:hypothetical protein
MRHLHVGMLFRFLPLVAAGLLATRLGIGEAVAILAGIGLVSVAAGAWILRLAPIGAINWRNRVASWLMPWGHVLGGPTLLAVAGSSFVAWILLALAGAIGWSEPWLLAAWMLDGIALRWLVASAWRTRGDRVQRRVVGRLVALVVALAVACLVCHLFAHPLLGAWIAGGPIAVVGIVFGLWTGLFLVIRPRFH